MRTHRRRPRPGRAAASGRRLFTSHGAPRRPSGRCSTPPRPTSRIGIHPLADRIADRAPGATSPTTSATPPRRCCSRRGSLDVLVGPAGSGQDHDPGGPGRRLAADARRRRRAGAVGQRGARPCPRPSGARCETDRQVDLRVHRRRRRATGAAVRGARWPSSATRRRAYWDVATPTTGATRLAVGPGRSGGSAAGSWSSSTRPRWPTPAPWPPSSTRPRAADAKVLLVGDHLQRGSVDAGGAFGMLARRGPTAELRTLWRFSHPWEARATLDLRHGDPAALDAYIQHGRVSHGTHDDMLDDALDRGRRRRSRRAGPSCSRPPTGAPSTSSTPAPAPNASAPAPFAPTGITLSDGLTAGVGDRIVTRRNNRRLRTSDGFVRNGDLWHDHRRPARRRPARPARRRTRRARTLRLPAAYVAESVELGYATTTARSPGHDRRRDPHRHHRRHGPRRPLRRRQPRPPPQPALRRHRPPRPRLPARRRDPRPPARSSTGSSPPPTPRPPPPRPGPPTTPSAPQPPLPATRPQPAIPPLRPQMTPRPLTPPPSPVPDGPVLERW